MDEVLESLETRFLKEYRVPQAVDIALEANSRGYKELAIDMMTTLMTENARDPIDKKGTDWKSVLIKQNFDFVRAN